MSNSGVATPLIGGPRDRSTRSRTAMKVAVFAVLACTVITFLVLSKPQQRRSRLLQSLAAQSPAKTPVMYYYVPKSAIQGNQLPMELTVSLLAMSIGFVPQGVRLVGDRVVTQEGGSDLVSWSATKSRRTA